MIDAFPPKSILRHLTTHDLVVNVEYQGSQSNPKADVSGHPEAQAGLRASVLDILKGDPILHGRELTDGDQTPILTVRIYVSVAVDTNNLVTAYLFSITMFVCTPVSNRGEDAAVIVWLCDTHGLQSPLLVADSVRKAVRGGLSDYTGRLVAARRTQ